MELLIIGILAFIFIILKLIVVIKDRGYKLGQSELIAILFSKYIVSEPEEVIEKINNDISSLCHRIASNNYSGFPSDNGKIEGKKEMLESIRNMLEDFKDQQITG